MSVRSLEDLDKLSSEPPPLPVTAHSWCCCQRSSSCPIGSSGSRRDLPGFAAALLTLRLLFPSTKARCLSPADLRMGQHLWVTIATPVTGLKHNMRKWKAAALYELLLRVVPGLNYASACAWAPRRSVLSGTGTAGRTPTRTSHGHAGLCSSAAQRYSVHKLEIKPKPLN